MPFFHFLFHSLTHSTTTHTLWQSGFLRWLEIVLNLHIISKLLTRKCRAVTTELLLPHYIYRLVMRIRIRSLELSWGGEERKSIATSWSDILHVQLLSSSAVGIIPVLNISSMVSVNSCWTLHKEVEKMEYACKALIFFNSKSFIFSCSHR